jgi:HTH-type transcriptional regulator / antitoxin HigA
MNNIHLIKSEQEYDELMVEILSLAKKNPQENSPEFEKLTILSMLIEEYDRKHFVKLDAAPVDAIKFRMEQQGLRPVDMKEYFGSTGRFYDVMNKKRNLSLAMIRKLHSGLDIAYENLFA